MSTIQSRKDEIEKKRQKLAELKRQRELRQSNLQQNRHSLDTTELVSPSPLRSNVSAKREELDSLISSLVDRAPSSSPARKDRSRNSGDNSGFETPSRSIKSPSPSRKSYADAATDVQSLGFADTTTVYEIPVENRPEYITYSKGVQTSGPWEPTPDTHSGGNQTEKDSSQPQDRHLSDDVDNRTSETQEEIRQRIRLEIEEELKALQLDQKVEEESERYPARSLAPEELNAVTSSNDFLDFVERSSKVIERALDEEYDVLSDYALRARQLEQDEGDEEYTGRKGRRIKEVAQYTLADSMGPKRMISALDFSPKFPELLCTAYTKSQSSHTPPGLLNVWNMHLKGRPEYSLHATSDLLSCLFHPHHPSLILGGTYSGQVCLWDTRARNQRTGEPVQKTPLMGGRTGHAHPVYSLSVVGTQNASSVVSVSTDGVVCAWSIDMLQYPQEYLELHSGNPALFKTDDVAPTCMAFPPADPTYFLAGTEQGNIMPVHRYDRAGAKKGVDSRCTYTGHEAPVMDIDFHPSRGKIDLGDLFVSGGLDWQVKLWRAKPPSSTVTSTTSANLSASTSNSTSSSASTITPLLTIPRSDAVYSTKWSPTRPSVFGLVDGAGKFDVYDLNVSSEVPVASAQPSHQEKEIYGLKSLNKLAWEKTQGKNVAVGGLDGITTVFEVGNELGGPETKGDAWLGVKRWLGRVGGARA